MKDSLLDDLYGTWPRPVPDPPTPCGLATVAFVAVCCAAALVSCAVTLAALRWRWG